jgi:protein translocase SEC61 complex gamma subunit
MAGRKFAMGFRDFLRSASAIFKLAHKSDRDEFTLYLKLVALGVAVVGTIGFLIKLIGAIFFG